MHVEMHCCMWCAGWREGEGWMLYCSKNWLSWGVQGGGKVRVGFCVVVEMGCHVV